MLKKSKKAFSLIELSIVILIISILVTGSLNISKSTIASTKKKITLERIEANYKSIASFVAIHKRLPCPANIKTIRGNPEYGDEAITADNCNDSLVLENASSLAYGMLPTKALGLADNMAEDGFGTKFSYVVDKRFTKKITKNAANYNSDGFEGTPSMKAPNFANGIFPEIIEIKSETSETLKTLVGNALFVLISHGSDKIYGFNATSKAQNVTLNTNDDSSTTNTEREDRNGYKYGHDNIFIAQSNKTYFDDIVLFKTKRQIIVDAGMEFIICSGLEAKDSTGSSNDIKPESGHWTWHSADYGSLGVKSNNQCALDGDVRGTTNNDGSTKAEKICGKYGIWASIKNAICRSNI